MSDLGINHTLYDFLDIVDINLIRESWRSDELKEKLKEFLIEESMDNKFKKAKQLIKELIKPHNKDELYNYIIELYDVEEATMKLTGKRDHVIHALNTFTLGLYINNKYLNNSVDIFQWKLAALFHDIAYPLDISQDIINRYTQKISEIKKDLHIENNNPPTLNLIPKNFEKLTNGISAFDLIQQTVDSWGLDINIKKRYEDMIKDNQLDHGILSSLTVLYLIDLMYQKNNPRRKKEDTPVDGSDWNQEYFERNIISACSAIYLHNLHQTDFFAKCKNKSKLAYLLKLCDELQNWDRPNASHPEGDSPKNYDIKVTENKLYFKAKSEKFRTELSENIACLNDDSVKIVEGFDNE